MHEEILAEKKLFNETREALNIKFHEERQSFEKYFKASSSEITTLGLYIFIPQKL